MKNFIFKSTTADLQKIIQSISTELIALNKNVIYCTYRLDWLTKEFKKMTTDKDLQQQVDKYFSEDDLNNTPEKELE